MCMTLTLKVILLLWEKAYLSQQIKKSPSKGNIALVLDFGFIN